MGDKPLFKSLFSDDEVTEGVYQQELVKLSEGRKIMRLHQFDPSLPLENGYGRYAGDAIKAAFGKNPPTRAEMAAAIGVPLDTLKGWMAPKKSKKHRVLHTEQFAMIVAAGVAHAGLKDTHAMRTEVACRMLYARTPAERVRDAEAKAGGARRAKVKAVALRAAALDPESLDLMLDLSERLMMTSAPAGGFGRWDNECVGYLFPSRGERRPDIEDDERESICRAEYFALVKDAVRNADVELIDNLWEAQPDESPIKPFGE